MAPCAATRPVHLRSVVDQCVDDDDLLGVVKGAGDGAYEDFGDLHGIEVVRRCASMCRWIQRLLLSEDL